MQFPLRLAFKVFAFAPQITVTDATGATLFYSKQKLFKLKETINVFADENQATQVATIASDSMITFSARFNFTDAGGQSLGGIGRKGFRSLWRAHYEVFTAAGEPAGTIREENPFVKVIDGLLGEVPFVGVFLAMLFQPRYLLTGADGTPLLRIRKRRTVFQINFDIESLANLSEDDAKRDVLATIMLAMLEKHRE